MKKRIYKKVLEIILGMFAGLFVSAILTSWFLPGSSIFLKGIVALLCSGTSYVGLQALKEEYFEKRADLKKKLSGLLVSEDEEKKKQKIDKTTQTLKRERNVNNYVSHKNIASDTKKSNQESVEPKKYYGLIGYYAEKNQIIYLEKELCFKINQFLNFVATRYFDELQAYKLEDKIIVLLLEQIFLNLKHQKENSFRVASLEFSSYNTITSVLDGCFFLPAVLKEKIKNDYIGYVSKNSDLNIEKYEAVNTYCWYSVLDDLELFTKLVNSIKGDVRSFLGPEAVNNFELIDWDLVVLKELSLNIIDSCGVEFFDYENMEESVWALLNRLIFEISLYVVLNNKKQVGCVEMLNSLKNCEGFLPLEVKMKVIDKLCLKYNISNHPYAKVNIQEPTVDNIIQFPVKVKK